VFEATEKRQCTGEPFSSCDDLFFINFNFKLMFLASTFMEIYNYKRGVIIIIIIIIC